MRVEVEFWYCIVKIDPVSVKLHVRWKVLEPSGEFLVPLASDVIGDVQLIDADCAEGGQNDVVHVAIPVECEYCREKAGMIQDILLSLLKIPHPAFAN